MNTVRPLAMTRVGTSIQRPRREVFLALTDPETLRLFWPEDAGEAILAAGVETQWTMEAGQEPVTVTCKQADDDSLIRLVFSNGTRVSFSLDRAEDGGTLLHYIEWGFGAEGDVSADHIARINSAATQMLADLRALLERDFATIPADEKPTLATAA